MPAGSHYRRIVKVVPDDWRALNALRRKLGRTPLRNGFLIVFECGHSKWVTVVRNPLRALCRACARRA